MKKENGITLISLVIYIIVMVIVVGAMSIIITNFYNNINDFQEDMEEVLKFSKFNTYFLKEIKSRENEIDNINNGYVLFSSGNSFSFYDNKIYYNNIQICDEVEKMQISLGKNGDGNDQSIIYVDISFKNYKKSMNYKLENVY